MPRDVSVMGFDNIASDYHFPLALSSVSVSKKNMANIASEILYGRMNGTESEPRRVVLPTKLYLRETTAPPVKE